MQMGSQHAKPKKGTSENVDRNFISRINKSGLKGFYVFWLCRYLGHFYLLRFVHDAAAAFMACLVTRFYLISARDYTICA